MKDCLLKLSYVVFPTKVNLIIRQKLLIILNNNHKQSFAFCIAGFIHVDSLQIKPFYIFENLSCSKNHYISMCHAKIRLLLYCYAAFFKQKPLSRNSLCLQNQFVPDVGWAWLVSACWFLYVVKLRWENENHCRRNHSVDQQWSIRRMLIHKEYIFLIILG